MKQLLFLILTLAAATASAQRPQNPRIEAYRVAFFTSELSLTEDEAKAFWPVYNAYQKEMDALHGKTRSLYKKETANMSDKELETLVENRFKLEEDKLNTQKKYYEKFKKVLPMQKVVLLPKVEKDFKYELLRQMKDKRGGRPPHGDDEP